MLKISEHTWGLYGTPNGNTFWDNESLKKHIKNG